MVKINGNTIHLLTTLRSVRHRGSADRCRNRNEGERGWVNKGDCVICWPHGLLAISLSLVLLNYL